MKHIYLIATFLLCGISLSAQKQIVWFDAGLKTQMGSSGLLNTFIIDDPNRNYELKFTNAIGFGGRIGINKNYSGLSLEAMYNQSKQTYEENTGLTSTNVDVSWNSLDLYTLFRNAKNLGYFEIGPKFSFLRSFEDAQGADVTENYSSTNIGAVLGFGAYVFGTDGAFSGILGLRFEYGVTNMTSSDAPDGYTPLGVITDGDGLAVDGGNTNPFFAGLVFELNWGIGYVGVAQCGARSKFIMF